MGEQSDALAKAIKDLDNVYAGSLSEPKCTRMDVLGCQVGWNYCDNWQHFTTKVAYGAAHVMQPMLESVLMAGAFAQGQLRVALELSKEFDPITLAGAIREYMNNVERGYAHQPDLVKFLEESIITLEKLHDG